MGPLSLPVAVVGLAIALPLLSAVPEVRHAFSRVVPDCGAAPAPASARSRPDAVRCVRIVSRDGVARILSFAPAFAENGAAPADTGAHA